MVDKLFALFFVGFGIYSFVFAKRLADFSVRWHEKLWGIHASKFIFFFAFRVQAVVFIAFGFASLIGLIHPD